MQVFHDFLLSFISRVDSETQFFLSATLNKIFRLCNIVSLSGVNKESFISEDFTFFKTRSIPIQFRPLAC